MKQALIVLVHGSPRPIANADMYRVLDDIRARKIYDYVTPGFLEINDPSIPDAIDQCVAEGANRIVAVPYFLHTGTHVAIDLPSLLDAAARRHPRVEFRLGRYLGVEEGLTEVLAERAGMVG